MGARRVVSPGLLLIVPAGLVWALTVVWPTARLVLVSFDRPTRGDEPGAAVPDNYSAAFAGGFVTGMLDALSVAALPLAVFVVAGLLLGWTGRRVGRRARLATRCAVAVPMALVPPSAAGVAWMFTTLGYDTSRFTGGRTTISDLRIAVLAGTWTLMCGVGIMVYLAAFRGGRRTIMVATGLAVLAAAAAGVQAFTSQALILPLKDWPVLNQRGLLPATRIFRDAVAFGQDGEFGPAAAESVIVLAVLAVLGVLAVGMLIASGTRLVIAPDRQSPAPPVPLGVKIITGVAVAAVLAATGYTAWPWWTWWKGALGHLDQLGYVDAGRSVAIFWLPALPSTLVSVALALLGGFGIGAMRPLGRRSGLLLLPFAPWLFVGIAPYAIARFLDVRLGLVSHTPPMWLSVPALVVFTLLFAGQEKAYQHAVEAGVPTRVAFAQAYVRPVLPAVALVALVTWVIQADDYFWLSLLTYLPGPEGLSRWIIPPLPLVLIGAAALAAAQFYLDRWAIVTRWSPKPLASGTSRHADVPAQKPAGSPAPSAAPPAPPVPSAGALLPAGLLRRWRPDPSTGAGTSAPRPPPRDGRPNFRVMLVCGAMGIAFAATGIVVGCGINTTGPPPRLPGAPSGPSADGESPSAGPPGVPNLAPHLKVGR